MLVSENLVVDAEKQELKQMDKKISSVWKKRMTVPDPYEVRLQKEKVNNDSAQAQSWLLTCCKTIPTPKQQVGTFKGLVLLVRRTFIRLHLPRCTSVLAVCSLQEMGEC